MMFKNVKQDNGTFKRVPLTAEEKEIEYNEQYYSE